MRKMYFALNALITPHLKDLDTSVRLRLSPDLEYVNQAFNEDVLSVEIDDEQIVSYDGDEGYAQISELHRAGKTPDGFWTQNESLFADYSGPLGVVKDAEVVVRAASHELDSVPHIRVIITSESELRTDPWWWATDVVGVLVKKYAPDWASIAYAGVKVNDKAFEAYYIPTVVKPKELRKTVTQVIEVASTALTNISNAFYSFDKKEVDLDLFL